MHDYDGDVMNGSILRNLPVLTLALMVLTACSSTRDTGGREPEVAFPPSTRSGDPLLDGHLVVEDVKVPRGSGDAAVFRIRNVTDRNLDSLTAMVQFFYDAPPGGLAKLASDGSSQVIDFAAGQVVEVKSVYRNHSPLRSLVLRVAIAPTVPGVTYFGGTVECTDVVSEPEKIAFVIKNVGTAPLAGLEYRVVLIARGDDQEITHSDWILTPGGGALGPRQEIHLIPRFAREVRGYPHAILQIRRKR